MIFYRPPNNDYTVTIKGSMQGGPIPFEWTFTDLIIAAYQAQGSPYRVTSTRIYQGSFTINAYYARGNHDWGGALMDLTYTPGANDPADRHWLQLVHTNTAATGTEGTGYHVDGEPSNVFWYIDNSPDFSNPFYDQGEPELTPTHFVDQPDRPWDGVSWFDAYTFLGRVTGENAIELSNKDLYWGFVDPIVSVPEPSSILLVLMLATLFAIGHLSKSKLHALVIKRLQSNRVFKYYPKRLT